MSAETRSSSTCDAADCLGVHLPAREPPEALEPGRGIRDRSIRERSQTWRADAGQLERVILNLAVNARDAAVEQHVPFALPDDLSQAEGPPSIYLPRVADPVSRVLFVSGYTDDALMSSGVELLPKPFTPNTLVARVQDVLRR